MRDSDNGSGRSVSRRRYAQILAGMGVAGLAGCPSGGGDGTPTSGGGGDTDTPGGDGEDDEATPTSADETATAREPATDTLSYAVLNSPSVFDWNAWTPQDNAAGDEMMKELTGLRNVHTREVHMSGVTLPAPHKPDREEIEVMTWFESQEVEPPFDWWHDLDDRARFWNGDPYDAVTREKHDHVNFFQAGNKFTEGATFNSEAESQWRYHGWFDKGEVPEQDPSPQARQVIAAAAYELQLSAMMHPDFTDPYIERYQDAGNADQSQSITDDLQSDRIPLQELAVEEGNGWGSGMYVLETMDDVGSESMILHKDEDHPNADNTNVEKLEILWASGDRLQTLQTNGAVDFNAGAVTPSGSMNRETLPDHMQEVTRFLDAVAGHVWKLNMRDEHLQNLWVRRALVEAIDWEAVAANGWGEESSIVTEHDTFLLDAQSESTFSDEFLDQLHTYSREQNLENANEYMRRAGYSKEGDQWVDPSGNPAEIDLMQHSGGTGYVQGCQTVRANLANWGFGVNFSTVNYSTWSNNMDPNSGLNYDSTIFWAGTNNVFGYYTDRGAWWGETLLGGSPTAESPYRLTEDDDYDTQGRPVHCEIPSEVGSIEAPDQAGLEPDLENGEEVDMFEVVQKIQQPGNSEEELMELYRTCARWYNFYLPNFVFRQGLSGAWGNVRDFDWPPADNRALDFKRAGVVDASVLGGVTQASYDTEFQPPE
ncbi:ABC transporter substrate-binding protein [Halosimplex halophilum]|uniref:ABC transporter substrate-binding protein n=1 Tax=Halosimplex halophilum TaxID=2559572 RepID=UPI001FECEAB9|nr:ABC transporter substrate-binding protein [Halosimplex halophilum]